MMNNYKDEVVEVIKTFLPTAKIILFGSRAKGVAQEGSDIDVALDIGKLIATEKLVEIKNSLQESNIPVLVDVIDLHAVDERLKEEISRDGVLWKQ